jgi:uncharacterized cupredoxin-like copper-binding protein
MTRYYRHIIAAAAVGVLLQLAPSGAVSYGSFGDLVLIEQLSFYPDTLRFPGDAVAVLVVQNREEGPIQHEVLSKELFQPGTLVSIAGTGEIEYDSERVAKVLLSPGQEIVIWFYARKGSTYDFQCNLNGHAMQATIRTF